MPTTTPTSKDPLLRARTLLAVHIAARDLQELTGRELVVEHEAGELITAARLLSVLDKRLKCLAVIAARIVHDVPWSEIATRLGVTEEVARALYDPAVCRWQEGDAAPWGPVLAARDARVIEGLHPIDITADNIEAIAAQTAPQVMER